MIDPYDEVKAEAEINDAIMALFDMPVEQLTPKMQDAINFYKDKYAGDWPLGRMRCMFYFRDCLLLEVMEWRNGNKNLNEL